MHFFSGNEDFGVFIPTCGLGGRGSGRGAGTVHALVSVTVGSSSSLDSLADESIFTCGIHTTGKGDRISAIRLAELSCRPWLLQAF